MHASQDNILIIKLGALGDFIQSFGVMRAIRQAHPASHITLLTTKPFENLAMACPYIDEYRIDIRPKWYQLREWVALSKWLNNACFKRVYDLQNSDRTALYFKMLRHKPEWVGAVKGASHCNDSPLRIMGHGFDGHCQTLSLAGITNIHVDDLSCLDQDISQFGIKDEYVLMVPGSAPGHTQKRWPAEFYGEIAGILWEEHKLRPVLIGTEAEKEVIHTILRLCPDAKDLSGQTRIGDISALARKARFAIGNDTGPMHIIGPTHIPTFVLFSSYSNPVRHKPLGENVYILQEDRLSDLSVSQVWDEVKSRSSLKTGVV